jgi:adenylate cyclase
MIIQGFLAGDSGQLNPIDALSSIPTVFMFVGILFPLNLVNTLICLSYLTITIIGLIPISELKVQFLMFSVPIPFILLVWNKYNTEYNNRLNFAKTVSIDQTKNLMQKTLKRYFGDVLSDKMLKEDGSISGENKWVTLSFTDISSYSTIIEHMSPKVAVEFLNEYFTAMHDVIEQHGGHILNYIGDCIMVVFGAPEEMDNHENQAIKCSMKMREKLAELNSRWDESELSRYWSNHGIEKITARTGVHTGSIIAGNIGSERMLQYSAIGDVVNVASRLEQANKEFGTDIAFSKEIYTALTKDLNSKAQSQGAISLKGREGETQVYSI